MKIYIDADGCPVLYNTINIAYKYSLQVVVISNTSHIFDLQDYENVTTVVCDKGRDRADFVIINKVEAGDIVVTQDYGLATMCLAKKGLAINQNGFFYTDKNIDKLLLNRHLAREERKVNKRFSKIKKRTKEDNENFEKSLIKLIEDNL